MIQLTSGQPPLSKAMALGSPPKWLGRLVAGHLATVARPKHQIRSHLDAVCLVTIAPTKQWHELREERPVSE